MCLLLLLFLQDPEELIEQHQVDHVKELLRKTPAPRYCCFYCHVISYLSEGFSQHFLVVVQSILV